MIALIAALSSSAWAAAPASPAAPEGSTQSAEWTTPAPSGDVFVPGPPGLAIWVDGTDTGAIAPATLALVRAGPHTVSFREGCRVGTVMLDVRAGVITRAEPVVWQSEGTLTVTGSQAGAAVLIDGAQVGRLPLAPLAVPCGAHSVRVEAAGFIALSLAADVAAGAGTAVVADLQKLPTGSVVVEITPLDATILLDGADRGTGPNTFEAVPQGPHELIGRKEGFLDAKVAVSVEPDGIARASLTLLPRPSFAVRAGLDRVRWGKVGVASALSLAAVGGGVGAAMLYRHAELNYVTYSALTWEDDTDGYYRSEIGAPRAEAWASGIAGGIAAASAGVLWVTLDRHPAILPFIGGGVGGGVGGVEGSF